jgi:hypothetical protein
LKAIAFETQAIIKWLKAIAFETLAIVKGWKQLLSNRKQQ